MMLLSIAMIADPESWSDRIVIFSEKPYFHPFEVLSRLVFGLVFIKFAEQTLYPDLMSAIGYLLLLVAAGLLVLMPTRHRQFAVWSAHRFKKTFRHAGLASLIFGAFIVYASVGV
jgi:uncharacterized protein YjeT (DUF2065 family)